VKFHKYRTFYLNPPLLAKISETVAIKCGMQGVPHRQSYNCVVGIQYSQNHPSWSWVRTTPQASETTRPTSQVHSDQTRYSPAKNSVAVDAKLLV